MTIVIQSAASVPATPLEAVALVRAALEEAKARRREEAQGRRRMRAVQRNVPRWAAALAQPAVVPHRVMSLRMCPPCLDFDDCRGCHGGGCCCACQDEPPVTGQRAAA